MANGVLVTAAQQHDRWHDAGAGNLISGNNDSSGMTADIGVEIIGSTASGNSVVGNLIGTD